MVVLLVNLLFEKLITYCFHQRLRIFIIDSIFYAIKRSKASSNEKVS